MLSLGFPCLWDFAENVFFQESPFVSKAGDVALWGIDPIREKKVTWPAVASTLLLWQQRGLLNRATEEDLGLLSRRLGKIRESTQERGEERDLAGDREDGEKESCIGKH